MGNCELIEYLSWGRGELTFLTSTIYLLKMKSEVVESLSQDCWGAKASLHKYIIILSSPIPLRNKRDG